MAGNYKAWKKDCSEDIALTLGILEGEAEKKGRHIPVIDALIGATSLIYNLTVVTRYIADIIPTGARILIPWTL